MQLVLSEDILHCTEQCETEQRPPVANIQFNGFQSTIWQFWYQNQQLTTFHNNVFQVLFGSTLVPELELVANNLSQQSMGSLTICVQYLRCGHCLWVAALQRGPFLPFLPSQIHRTYSLNFYRACRLQHYRGDHSYHSHTDNAAKSFLNQYSGNYCHCQHFYLYFISIFASRPMNISFAKCKSTKRGSLHI